LIDQLDLPDPDGRHVLAAAIRAHAGDIVTYNIRDFPAESLKPYGIEAQHPDEFVTHLLDLSPDAVYAAVRDRASRSGTRLDPRASCWTRCSRSVSRARSPPWNRYASCFEEPLKIDPTAPVMDHRAQSQRPMNPV